MAFSNFPNPFFGSDLAAQQQWNGSPGALGGAADPSHAHTFVDPSNAHARGLQHVSNLAEMQRQQAMREMDRLLGANDRVPPRHGSIEELARWLELNPGADVSRYQSISQPAPNKVLLLLE